MTDITKDAKRVLIRLYGEYLSRKKSGQSRQDSIYFGDSNQIQAAFFPNENPDDIASYCWELHKKEYISCTPGDNIANDITLQPNTIVFMEQRFPRGLKQVLEVLGQISSFV